MNRKFCIASLIVDSFILCLSICIGIASNMQIKSYDNPDYSYAKVLFCSKQANRDGKYSLQLEYPDAEGSLHSVIVNGSKKKFAEGEEVLIIYNADTPEDFEWGSNLFIPIYILGGLGIASLIWLMVILIVKLKSSAR